MSNKILFITIGTNKYYDLAQNCFESIRTFWKSNDKISFMMFSNRGPRNEFDFQTKYSNTPHLPWPLITLLRYKFFLQEKEFISKFDYVIYIDADMEVVAPIGDEMLGERIVVLHPGFYNQWGGPYEQDPKSQASVIDLYALAKGLENFNHSTPDVNAKLWKYYQGCLQGGSSSEFLKMCQVLSDRINEDLKNNYIAVWHDESHMNKYMIENPPTKVLSCDYAYPEKWNIPFTKKIIGKDKNHAEIRTEGN